MIFPTDALSIPQLSPPQFTVTFVDRSYDVPKTTWTTTDPFNGQQITQNSGGNRVTNRTIDITIDNQQFTPITLDNGTVIQLFYQVRSKGHFEEWAEVRGSERISEIAPNSASQSTVITIIFDQSTRPYYDIPLGGTEDFQVKAVAGYYDKVNTLQDLIFGGTFHNLTESDWSNTLTINVGEAPTPSITPNALYPSPTDSLPNFGPTSSPTPNNGDLAIIVASIATTVAILCVIVLVLYVRHLKKQLKISG
jgi:hypothetical protein